MLTGAEVLLSSTSWIKKLKNKQVAYLGHLAGVDQKGHLILSHLLKHKDIELRSLFSPQHGFSSIKQANMITTEDSIYKGLKLYSLYSEKTRRLTPEMEQSFEVLLFDLQDVGCRIYTYLSTLFYLLEDCAKADKMLIVLDRPNPLGRYVEGNILREKFKSFVGLAPLPISHGLTLGELAIWYKDFKNLKIDLEVIPIKDYPSNDFWSETWPWVLPSPNMTGLSCARCYPGTVLLEGTHISEGRGTTQPFEIFGHPDMDAGAVLQCMQEECPSFLQGSLLREMEFEPVFDKFKARMCKGFQIHLEKVWAGEKRKFRPYRLICGFLKAFRQVHPTILWKSKPPYEYEWNLDPIDMISGSDELQKWMLANSFLAKSWDEFLCHEENEWEKERKDFLIYK